VTDEVITLLVIELLFYSNCSSDLWTKVKRLS